MVALRARIPGCLPWGNGLESVRWPGLNSLLSESLCFQSGFAQTQVAMGLWRFWGDVRCFQQVYPGHS